MAKDQQIIDIPETEKVFSKDFIKLNADGFTIVRFGTEANATYIISLMKTVFSPTLDPAGTDFIPKREIVATLEVSKEFLDLLDSVRLQLGAPATSESTTQ